MSSLRIFYVLWAYEMRRLFLSPITYVMGFLFLSLMGFLFFLLTIDYVDAAQEVPIAEAFFSIFWLPTLIWVPLLTMRTLADDRQAGTLALLGVTQARPFSIIGAKFLSTYILYLFLWSLALSFNGLLYVYNGYLNTGGERCLSALLGGYIFIATSGFMYIAIGIFSSSLTRSQLMAGMMTFMLLFVMIVTGRILESLPLCESLRGLDLWYFFDPFEHLDDFSSGIVDSRCCILYVLFGVVSLCFSAYAIDKKD